MTKVRCLLGRKVQTVDSILEVAAMVGTPCKAVSFGNNQAKKIMTIESSPCLSPEVVIRARVQWPQKHEGST